MSIRQDPFRLSVLMLAVVVIATGCDDSDDGGSAGTVRAFFGSSNIRECMPIEVEVDLLADHVVVARRDNGSLDCAIDASLVNLGCTGTFDLAYAGQTLRVVIDGCEVPPVASLFECGFSEGNIASIGSDVFAFCECVGEPICHLNIFCDSTPEICVSDEANPSACEDCSNGVDDDGNGETDCADPNCHVEECGYGQTTITCPTSTTTTTTIVGVTTTLIVP